MILVFLESFLKSIDEIFFDYEEIKTKLQKMEKINFPKVFADNFFGFSSKSFNRSSYQKYKQVMIKNISSLSKGGIQNALAYVVKNSDSSLCENQKGEKEKVSEIIKDWQRDFTGKKNAKEAMHLVFSIDEDFTEKNIESLEKSVRETLGKNFFEYKWVMVKHTHQNNLHIHALINKNNIYTKKKLHFKTKSDCKNFFNQLREDFKDSLNFHNRDFHYENKYKFEREFDFKKLCSNQKIDLSNEVMKNLKQISNKISICQENIKAVDKELESLSNEQKRLREDFIKNKNFKVATNLKKIHQKIREIYRQKKKFYVEINELKNGYRKIEEERKFFNHQDYSELKKQERFLEFIKSKKEPYLKNLSKSSIEAYKKLQSDFKSNRHKVLDTSLSYIQAHLMMFKIFNKKTNVFKIDSAIETLNRDLNILKELKQDKLNPYENIDNLIKENQKKQNELRIFIKERFVFIRERINTEVNDKNIAFFKKELELIETKYHIKSPNIENKTQDSIQKEILEDIKNVNTNVDLNKLNIDGFLDWYISKKILKDKEAYKMNIYSKIKNNELENFKELYKRFQMEFKKANQNKK